MGIGLTHPISSKVLLRHGSQHFRVGAATMHGWRETMEDAHSITLSLPNHPNTAFFGIFDGHSGALCSAYVSKHLEKNIDALDKDAITNTEVLRKIVLKTDQDFLDSEEYQSKEDGSAGIFTLIAVDTEKKTYKLINANIGDSRTVLAKKRDNGYEAVTCTHDHKPTKEEERKRIEAAGGHVSLARVDGQLALSRAFGDRMLKKPMDIAPEQRKVTANPDFMEVEAVENDFLFLACDGIYEGDIFRRDTVINFIAEKMQTTDDLAHVCAAVLDECLQRGSRDNMSGMIIQFKDGSDYANRENEYVPGPWYEDEGDSKFQEAYQKDAEAAGYTLDEARKLREKLERESLPAGQHSNPVQSSSQ